jgi:hypothetical protein
MYLPECAQAKGIRDWLTDLNARRVQLKPDGEDKPYPDVSASRPLDHLARTMFACFTNDCHNACS